MIAVKYPTFKLGGYTKYGYYPMQ